DLAGMKKIGEVPVGSHPNQMLLADARHLVVSSSDSDSVSLLDLDTLREIQRIDLRLPGSSLSGAQPNALACRDDLLFVALGALSGVAVLQLDQHKDLDIRFLGVIPVGPFPTALSYSKTAKTIFIASGRNLVTGPNTHPANGRPYQYIGEIIGG